MNAKEESALTKSVGQRVDVVHNPHAHEMERHDHDVILVTEALYMARPGDYFAALTQVQDSNTVVMVVGHNPGIEDFVTDLTGQWERMPTAALAHIQLDIDSWQSLDLDTPGELLNIWRPKEI